MSGIKTFFKNGAWRKVTKYALMVAMVSGTYSCKREIPKRELLANHEVQDFSELFHVFWTGLNANYQFWDVEKVNWDSMYRAYKPKFDSLNLRPYSDTSINQCFQWMTEMTRDLQDGQYVLQLWSGGDYRFEDSLYKSYISFIPKLQRTQRIRQALPDTLFDYISQYNYLDDFDYGVYRNFNTNQIHQIITGRIKKGAKDLIYTSINNFMLKESYNAAYTSRPPRPVIKNLFDNIHKGRCDGIIIDLRNNRGGNLEDIDFFVGQFTAKPALYGYVRYKSGSGRLDYTPTVPLNITPQAGATDFKKPIVILADIYSSALCEIVIQAFRGLPDLKVTVIGERTYGTAGLITGNDISTNGGTFNMGSFATARMSNAALQDRNHNFNFTGISPDVEVRYDAAAIQTMLQTGVDIQLEKAIQYLNQ